MSETSAQRLIQVTKKQGGGVGVNIRYQKGIAAGSNSANAKSIAKMKATTDKKISRVITEDQMSSS